MAKVGIHVLKPGGKFITVEIIKDIRLVIAVLIFTFVWKTDVYWKRLFQKSKFKNLKSKYRIRFLKLATYILLK